MEQRQGDASGGDGGYLTRWRRSTATLGHTRSLICCKLSAVSAWLPINQRAILQLEWCKNKQKNCFLRQYRFIENSEHANWNMFSWFPSLS